jgi:hypothetical protein
MTAAITGRVFHFHFRLPGLAKACMTSRRQRVTRGRGVGRLRLAPMSRTPTSVRFLTQTCCAANCPRSVIGGRSRTPPALARAVTAYRSGDPPLETMLAGDARRHARAPSVSYGVSSCGSQLTCRRSEHRAVCFARRHRARSSTTLLPSLRCGRCVPDERCELGRRHVRPQGSRTCPDLGHERLQSAGVSADFAAGRRQPQCGPDERSLQTGRDASDLRDPLRDPFDVEIRAKVIFAAKNSSRSWPSFPTAQTALLLISEHDVRV